VHFGPPVNAANGRRSRRWSINGNEAAGLGALRAGVRFVAAYPITPASEMLEWLAPRLEQVGGALLQAEDELASINMIIGSSFGGVPSLTATSGPGLSLMMEGIGLAVASETPVVVVDVMRGGPSTGIPTKSEQSDLEIALYGLHGDAPHLVLAALGIGDCAFTFALATRLAWQLQTAAIVLSDQSLGQSRHHRALRRSPGAGAPARHLPRTSPRTGPALLPLCRHADGISPMSVPGEPGLAYTADGLEHNRAHGTPSSSAGTTSRQLDKRLRKLTAFDFGDAWAEITGDARRGLRAHLGARPRRRRGGRGAAACGRAERPHGVSLRLLAPAATRRAGRRHRRRPRCWWSSRTTARSCSITCTRRALPADARSLARPGPLPLRPGEIVADAAPRLIQQPEETP
jgi:2-oxoglutarate ferredoxin oxidoreductase subunit alpha